MIIPTIGRCVWWHPDNYTTNAAIITDVFSDNCVNLVAFTSIGMPYSVSCAIIIQDEDIHPSCLSGYAEWMPYQKGQAAKTEELEKKRVFAEE